jgi:hypothetical protein
MGRFGRIFDPSFSVILRCKKAKLFGKFSSKIVFPVPAKVFWFEAASDPGGAASLAANSCCMPRLPAVKRRLLYGNESHACRWLASSMGPKSN